MALKDDIILQNGVALQPVDMRVATGLERLFPHLDDASRLLVSCYRADYSASRIARAVEDCDAHLLNLNVTDQATEHGEIIVDLRINLRNASSVARSLERYGYNVLWIGGGSQDAHGEVTADRVSQLLAQINV